ncbi:hypothetical protein Q8F55_004738 [Vanrija albida]|uniref:Uncharacterized protein n=1 Tax=Vanrija albida TaxID=181172 RepID=A0ABR3Q0A1_9TREE
MSKPTDPLLSEAPTALATHADSSSSDTPLLDADPPASRAALVIGGTFALLSAVWQLDNGLAVLAVLLVLLGAWLVAGGLWARLSTALDGGEEAAPARRLNPFSTWTKDNSRTKAALLIAGDLLLNYGAATVDDGHPVPGWLLLTTGLALVIGGLWAPIPQRISLRPNDNA